MLSVFNIFQSSSWIDNEERRRNRGGISVWLCGLNSFFFYGGLNLLFGTEKAKECEYMYLEVNHEYLMATVIHALKGMGKGEAFKWLNPT